MEIETGVPVPPLTKIGPIPFDQMQVGQSVMVPCPQASRSVAVRASRYAKDTGKQFTCRTVPGGVRVWRIG